MSSASWITVLVVFFAVFLIFLKRPAWAGVGASDNSANTAKTEEIPIRLGLVRRFRVKSSLVDGNYGCLADPDSR